MLGAAALVLSVFGVSLDLYAQGVTTGARRRGR